MLFNFFKISILSLCIIILIHYIINYSKNILTKPKIIDYRKKIKKEEEKINIEEKKEHIIDFMKEEKDIIDFMKEEKEEHIIDFMKEELTEYLNKIK
jgi:uncharacterized ion transporter superfamily protein YfcC